MVLACLFLGASMAHGQALSADEIKALDRDLASFIKTFNSHDPTQLAKEFTEDAELVSETGERTKGRAAIKAMFVELFKKNPRIRNEISDVTRRKIDSKTIIEEGTFRATGMKDAPPMQGRYCAMLVDHDGRWIVRHEQDFIPVASPDTAKAEVQKANEDYEAIILKNDVEGFKRILSDDYVFIDIDASVKNKAEVVKDSGQLKMEVARSEDVLTRFFGNTAILTGIWIEKGTRNNEAFDNKSQFTTIFAKRDGTWKVVSDQLTEMKK